MFDYLRKYAEAKRATGGWDGTIPSNHKVGPKPQKNLGRWVNRQRAARTKNKLKPKFLHKLQDLGLEWTQVNSRARTPQSSAAHDEIPEVDVKEFEAQFLICPDEEMLDIYDDVEYSGILDEGENNVVNEDRNDSARTCG